MLTRFAAWVIFSALTLAICAFGLPFVFGYSDDYLSEVRASSAAALTFTLFSGFGVTSLYAFAYLLRDQSLWGAGILMALVFLFNFAVITMVTGLQIGVIDVGLLIFGAVTCFASAVAALKIVRFDRLRSQATRPIEGPAPGL